MVIINHDRGACQGVVLTGKRLAAPEQASGPLTVPGNGPRGHRSDTAHSPTGAGPGAGGRAVSGARPARRLATDAPTRACQHPQVTARPHGGVQLGPAHANADRGGHAARPPGTRGGGGPDARRRAVDTSHRLLAPFRHATRRSHVRMSDAGSRRIGPRRRVRMRRLTTGC